MIHKSLRNFAKILTKYPISTYRLFLSEKRFERELSQYRSMCKSAEQIVLYPCLDDWTTTTIIEPTYFYQDSWAFERIVLENPSQHVDIGSHHKYVALLSKVVPLTMVDIRPLSCYLDSIKFIQGSILDIPFPDQSIESLSSLCVVEHIGLGRYGDPLDPNGSINACKELARVIKTGGSLYLSVPIERFPKTYFNAHRSFDEEAFLANFIKFSVREKAYIYGNLFTTEKQDIFGIGCYHLEKTS